MEEEVTITAARLKDLEDSEALLVSLQNAGVDNWSGYDYAMELYQEYEG